MDKPAVLALNKIDCDPEGKAAEEVLQKLKNLPGMLINCQKGFLNQ